MPLSGSYTGIGVAPEVVEAYSLTQTRAHVSFSEPMTPDATLQDPASYTITPDFGSAARTVEAVTLGPGSFPLFVVLHLDGALTVGVDNYQVAVNDAVVDAVGNTLNPLADTADFSGVHTATPIDHCASALDRLAEQFKSRARLTALVCKLADPAQDLEQAGQDVLAFRALETAFGAQLDSLGTTLRQPRDGQTDADYRVVLRAKVQVLASKGRPDEQLAILTTLDDGFAPASISLVEHVPAWYVLHCLVPLGEQLRGERFARLLREAKPAGVGYELEFEERGATLFSWVFVAGSDAAPPANSGWDEDGTGTNAGLWAEASAGQND